MTSELDGHIDYAVNAQLQQGIKIEHQGLALKKDYEFAGRLVFSR
jgi:hypothetical protein